MFEGLYYIADSSIPGLAESEVARISANDRRPSGPAPRGLDRHQLRDLGLDRSAA